MDETQVRDPNSDPMLSPIRPLSGTECPHLSCQAVILALVQRPDPEWEPECSQLPPRKTDV